MTNEEKIEWLTNAFMALNERIVSLEQQVAAKAPTVAAESAEKRIVNYLQRDEFPESVRWGTRDGKRWVNLGDMMTVITTRRLPRSTAVAAVDALIENGTLLRGNPLPGSKAVFVALV